MTTRKIRSILRGDARTVANIAHQLDKASSIDIATNLTPKLVDEIKSNSFHGICLVKDLSGDILGMCSPGILASTLMTGGMLDDRFIEPIIRMPETETISSARLIMRKQTGSIVLLIDDDGIATALLSVNDLLIT